MIHNAFSAVLNSQTFSNQISSSITYLPNLPDITRLFTHCVSPTECDSSCILLQMYVYMARCCLRPAQDVTYCVVYAPYYPAKIQTLVDSKIVLALNVLNGGLGPYVQTGCITFLIFYMDNSQHLFRNALT